jgi:AcrR family transcriptional regulator
LADKRQAIIDGALTVYSRDGYSRSSIDAIAAEAGVSTRTIYNHFETKQQLFRTVIEESTARVADIQVAVIERHLGDVTDLEADLVAFGRAFVTTKPDTAVHFALIRHIHADAEHIPPEVIRTWHETGPLRVRRALAARLAELADRGLLRIDDPEQAALHLALLVSAGNVPPGISAPTKSEITATVKSGVHAFLHGYAAGTSVPAPGP